MDHSPNSTLSPGINRPASILSAKDRIIFREDVEVFRGFCAIQNRSRSLWGDEYYWETIILDFSGDLETCWYDGPFFLFRPYGLDPRLGVGMYDEPGMAVLWTTVDL